VDNQARGVRAVPNGIERCMHDQQLLRDVHVGPDVKGRLMWICVIARVICGRPDARDRRMSVTRRCVCGG
jgi:hypothetical protein